MKMSWFLKELSVVLAFLLISVVTLIWAIVEGSNSPHRYSVVVIGFLSGFVPIFIEFIVSYRNGTLFLRDKQAVAAKKQKNARLSKMFFLPAVGLGVTFAYFPGAIKVFLLSVAAGYLLPFSIVLLIHFLKNHKEIEKITKSI